MFLTTVVTDNNAYYSNLSLCRQIDEGSTNRWCYTQSCPVACNSPIKVSISVLTSDLQALRIRSIISANAEHTEPV